MANQGNRQNEKILTRMFKDRASAERAYKNMYEKGYRATDINILMSEDTKRKFFADTHSETDTGIKALEGAGAGTTIGGAIGATAGLIATIGSSLALPGIGLIIAGPLAGALAGAGAGGITGGIIGTLIGAGIPEERAKKYEQDIKKGKILMGIRPRSDEDASNIESDWKNDETEYFEK